MRKAFAAVRPVCGCGLHSDIQTVGWLPWRIAANTPPYDLSVSMPEEIGATLQGTAAGQNLRNDHLQKEPVRYVPNLMCVPITIVTGGASHRAGLDYLQVL